MTVFNVVRFRVKAGREEDFLAAHRDGNARWPGLVNGHIIRTGERSYCLIGEWADIDAIKAARAPMIATLDSFRDTLEDLGGGLGVTDAVSGEKVVDLLA
ncbi:MAG TPA: antibiotic biosynthesis monooxygenase [Bosea sp. (in: a-proteobacteria)]|jgi:quinol monooxygenase YgiN|uniref:antibiotic biosynthesis monooxygenase n=1 Tax=Bosea sp. (in: a-proteobacteria) TaxID=1871050 RepID=UPI002E10FDCF|nr:antibiotic biosynthesis monooxygenase [Bosea sp. (in: a-proteobacteria)]